MADHRFMARRSTARGSVLASNRGSIWSHRGSVVMQEAGLQVHSNTDDMDGIVRKLRSGLKCKYDMWALPMADVLNLSGTLPDHQTLIAQGKLVKVTADDPRPVVFLSHQWVGFNGPDPAFKQFSVFQQAARNVLGGLEVDLSPHMKAMLAIAATDGDGGYTEQLKGAFSNGLCWYDFFSIPQPTSKLAEGCVEKTVADLNRAVESIPYYVAKSQHFVALTPPTVHADTHKLCDTHVYQGRGWCRLERKMWNIVGGGKCSMFITGPKSLNVSLQMLDDLVSVGEGEFTCCSRFEDHTVTDPQTGEKIRIPCDKQKIGRVLVPLLSSLMECYREAGKLHEYRWLKAGWQSQCRQLDINAASESMLALPETWAQFCEAYMLPSDEGMHFSRKRLQQLGCLPPLFYAVYSGNSTIVKIILDSSVDPNFAIGSTKLMGSNHRGYTALHVAALGSSGDDVKWNSILRDLMAAKGDPYLKTKFLGVPMWLAMFCHNEHFLNWMYINHGGLKYERVVYPSTGNHMVHILVNYGLAAFVNMAVDDNANFNAKCFPGYVSIHSLCFSPTDTNYHSSPLEVFKVLLARGVVKDINVSMQPPFNIGGFIFRLLQFLSRCDFRLRRMRGQTSLANMHPIAQVFAHSKSSTMLHGICSKGGATDLLEFLLDKNADPTLKNALGMTPLEVAIDFKQGHHEQIMRQALESQESNGKIAVNPSKKKTSVLQKLGTSLFGSRKKVLL